MPQMPELLDLFQEPMCQPVRTGRRVLQQLCQFLGWVSAVSTCQIVIFRRGEMYIVKGFADGNF